MTLRYRGMGVWNIHGDTWRILGCKDARLVDGCGKFERYLYFAACQWRIADVLQSIVCQRPRREQCRRNQHCPCANSVRRLALTDIRLGLSSGCPVHVLPQSVIHFAPNSIAVGQRFVQVWNDQQGQIDLNELAQELRKVYDEGRVSASGTSGEEMAVAELAKAEDAAKQGDGPRVLGHLARAGEWALRIAVAIGVPVAVKALEAAIGS